MHEVNTIYKREPIAFTKDNIHFHSSLTIIQRLHPSYMTLEQVVEMKPVYQKQKGHENLVLTPQVIYEVTSYQAIC
jgi:PHD/YefM family antitoxin component YafN of YafNO toxin-antitoxin module